MEGPPLTEGGIDETPRSVDESSLTLPIDTDQIFADLNHVPQEDRNKMRQIVWYYSSQLQIKTQELTYAEQSLSEIRERVHNQLLSQETGVVAALTTQLESVTHQLRLYEAELEIKASELAFAENALEEIKEKLTSSQSPSKVFPPTHYLHDSRHQTGKSTSSCQP
jgi:chromosome segregation ATPase